MKHGVMIYYWYCLFVRLSFSFKQISSLKFSSFHFFSLIRRWNSWNHFGCKIDEKMIRDTGTVSHWTWKKLTVNRMHLSLSLSEFIILYVWVVYNFWFNETRWVIDTDEVTSLIIIFVFLRSKSCVSFGWIGSWCSGFHWSGWAWI